MRLKISVLVIKCKLNMSQFNGGNFLKENTTETDRRLTYTQIHRYAESALIHCVVHEHIDERQTRVSLTAVVLFYSISNE